MQVGFIGVGAMGSAMAQHCSTAGFKVCAYDADPDSLAKACQNGVVPAASIAEMAKIIDVAVIMVANDAQSRAVTRVLLDGDLRKGAVIVVAATNHPRTMIDLDAECAKKNVGFVDAPVCYGLQGALQGELISLCGGRAQNIATITPVLKAYSRSVEHIGPTGCGQIGKTCNNMMHWAACVANYETLALAKACGINAQAMRETLLKCPARNTTLERWDTSKFTWQEKDKDVAREIAQSAGLSLPLVGVIDQLVKRIGPKDVHALLHEENAAYLGLPITPQKLDQVV